MMWRLFLIGLICFASAAEYRLPKAQRYTVTVSPNLTVVGSYYPSPSSNAQLVVLLHMLGRNRGDWNECARFLQKEGYAVVSLDLPGHGESTNSRSVMWRSFTEEQFQQNLGQSEEILRDVRQKYAPQQILVIGMGYGASLAMYLHSKGYSLATVLIEPIQTLHGIDVTQYLSANDKPIYVLINKDDDLVQKIRTLAANCTVDVYTWSLNPLRWFFGNTVQYENIVSWLRRHTN